MRKSRYDYERYERNAMMAKQFERIFKRKPNKEPDHEPEDEDTGERERDAGNGKQHLIGELADLIAEAGSKNGNAVSREDALRWLIHTPRGASLIARLAQTRKRQTDKGTTMTSNEAPVLTICKRAVATTKTDLSETELTKLITEYALQDRRDGETVEKCFSRVVCALTPEGLTLRKALEISKGNGSRFGNEFVGQDRRDNPDAAALRSRRDDDDDQDDADDEDRDDDQDDDSDEDRAMIQLNAKARELRKREPGLSPEQAFSKVYQNRSNLDLVKRERRRNGYTFARSNG